MNLAGSENTLKNDKPSVPLPKSSAFFAAGRRTRENDGPASTDGPVASDVVCFGLAGALLREGF